MRETHAIPEIPTQHVLDGLSCWCAPAIQFYDEHTGEPFARPVIVHYPVRRDQGTPTAE